MQGSECPGLALTSHTLWPACLRRGLPCSGRGVPSRGIPMAGPAEGQAAAQVGLDELPLSSQASPRRLRTARARAAVPTPPGVSPTDSLGPVGLDREVCSPRMQKSEPLWLPSRPGSRAAGPACLAGCQGPGLGPRRRWAARRWSPGGSPSVPGALVLIHGCPGQLLLLYWTKPSGRRPQSPSNSHGAQINLHLRENEPESL